MFFCSRLPPGNRTEVFPAFDHIHFHFLEGGEKRSRTGNVGPKEWLNFLDETGIDWTVVYPTAGLAVGRIIAEDWAIAACRAYNNWRHEKFTKVSPRIKGMALIPIQDADAAVEELCSSQLICTVFMTGVSQAGRSVDWLVAQPV